MATEYRGDAIPSTDFVRLMYAQGREDTTSYVTAPEGAYGREFDRWLAWHDDAIRHENAE